MKQKIILFIISVLVFLNVNAHSPNSDSLIVYIDNIFIGKRCCVDLNRIPSVILESYYCNYLLECSDSGVKISVDAPFSTINPKGIKQLFIEKNDALSANGILHIRTKKVQDGFLFVNKSIMDAIADLNFDLDKLKISYAYNNRVVETKEDVMRVIKLRKKRIEISEISHDKQTGVITVYILDK